MTSMIVKIGDLVATWAHPGSNDANDGMRIYVEGLVVGFNEKGHGGKDYVHILRCDTNRVETFMTYDLTFVDPKTGFRTNPFGEQE